MDFIVPLDEEIKKRKNDYFIGFDDIKSNINKILELIFDKNKNVSKEILEYFNINGNIMLYGNPGVGKTSLSLQVANYVLSKYGIKSYRMNIADIISKELGDTTKNISEAIKIIKSKKYGILLIMDEIDRIFIDRRNTDELSELKRMLLEFMDFIDNVRIEDKIIIIGITNLYDNLDDAFKRRFLFNYEMFNDKNLIEKYILNSNKILNIDINKKDIKHYSSKLELNKISINTIKTLYRNLLIECDINDKKLLKNELMHKINLLLNGEKK